jgi:TPR repeat protein
VFSQFARCFVKLIAGRLRARARLAAHAQVNLGLCFQHGISVAQDSVGAVRLYWLSAAQDSAEALRNLGGLYLEGEGLAQDFAEAARLIGLAGRQGARSCVSKRRIRATRSGSTASANTTFTAPAWRRTSPMACGCSSRRQCRATPPAA